MVLEIQVGKWPPLLYPVPIPQTLLFPPSIFSLIVFSLAFSFIWRTSLLPLSLSPLTKLLNIDSACRGHGGPRGRRVGDLRWFWAPGSQRRCARSGPVVSTLLLDRHEQQTHFLRLPMDSFSSRRSHVCLWSRCLFLPSFIVTKT